MTDFDVVLLAAQRPGQVNPLAEKHGVSHKCLVPVAGVALLERVLSTLTRHPGCKAIRLVIEEDGYTACKSIIDSYARPDLPITPVPPSTNIAESAIAGCQAANAPYLITTADNVLLSPKSIDLMMEKMAAGSDGLLALSTREAVHGVHMDAQRFFYKVCGGEYANCNLYAISGEHALNAANMFREGGQFMSNPGRLIRAFGLVNIALARLGWVSMDWVSRRVSRRFGITLNAVMLSDGTQAVDVDNERTYGIVEGVLTGAIPTDPDAGPPPFQAP